MGDAQARALERETSLEGRARLLAHRLRVGSLREIPCPEWPGDPLRHLAKEPGCEGYTSLHCERCGGTGVLPGEEVLELVAYAGDEAARMVVPDTAPGSALGWACADNSAIEAWARGFARWGQAVCVRAAVAAGRVAWAANGSDDAAYVNAGMDTTSRAYPLRALDAAQAWLDDPSKENACLLGERVSEPWSAYSQPHCDPIGSQLSANMREHNLCVELNIAKHHVGEQAVRDAIRDSLTRWALARP